ncbi:MAG: 3-oxoacyl-ACP reductase [Gammaproteobacteria bacterium]|nr:MAG: 3-oxoacyl-ACP reductase [Gammaproteobacteria bacterium]
MSSSFNNENLKNKVALITGSGRGIGRALAIKFAQEGAKVMVNDLDQKPADEVVASITQAGGEAYAYVGSVTEPDFAENFIKAAISIYGTPDILVNNAGYTWDSMIHKASDEQFDAMYDIHLKAPFCLNRAFTQAVVPLAKEEAKMGVNNYRKIVNISSISGEYGNIGQVNYSSMKSALGGMTKTLSKELGRYKINVNCVAFGFIETRLTEATDEKKTITVDGNEVDIGIPKDLHAGFTRMIPLGRAGTAEEAANGVYLFCTPESNYISGQTIIVGGGVRM